MSTSEVLRDAEVMSAFTRAIEVEEAREQEFRVVPVCDLEAQAMA